MVLPLGEHNEKITYGWRGLYLYIIFFLTIKSMQIPISGIATAAGGVLSARSNSSTKNATNTLIPV